MPPRETVRYNCEGENVEEGPWTRSYLTVTQATQLVREMKEGDGLVINAVAGPGVEEDLLRDSRL